MSNSPTATALHQVAWARYPSLRGPWQPSKIHYSAEQWGNGTLCGAKKGRDANYSKPYEMRAHAADAGYCSRCKSAAKKRGMDLPREEEA